MSLYKRTNFIFGLLISGLILVLFWSAITRLNDYKEYHRSIGQNSVQNVSESISSFINERKRLIQVFADEHASLIEKSAQSPLDENIKSQLEAEIKKYFPEYFSFTVTDTKGEPYFDDFDSFIGDLCLSDIKSFIDNKTASPRVHPHHEVYHYDLLARVKIKNKKYIFFISFPADEVSAYLKSAQGIGHKVILALKQLDNIIEITTAGARNKKFREDYRLTNEELSYLTAEKNISGTLWTAYDFNESDLISNYKIKLILDTSFILFVFLVVGIVLFFLLKNEEKKRLKAEAVKSEFVAVVSHELRTPLTSISGAIKLIENEALGKINKEIKVYLNLASNNIDRLTSLVNDILDVKKMETGEFDLEQKNINLVDVIEQAIQDNTDYAKKFDATFYFEKPKKNYTVYADKSRLLQVLTNLLSNAVKYGAEKDIIKIYLKELAGKIQVNIEDHGKGLSEKNKEYVFEKFTQSHSREDELVQGTGLGLNIAKKIIDKHDGTISYRSKKNKGTVFYFILPLSS